MKNKNLTSQFLKVGGGLAVAVLVPGPVWGCACGCGIFEVGTSSMFPEGTGGMAFQTYDFQNQNENWNNSSKAPSANNQDKNITTSFLSTGVQYFFNRSWGVEGEIPFAYRSFTTLRGASPVTSK
ncbi:MAG TPA: hypothetical protein VNX46_07455, partial [Candidatus Acidoferrum sp.]|nr:hypothetical protein [Candidatus Acidoferrum sp.]